MRTFVLGIIVTLVVAFVVVLLILQFGLMPTNADATPPAFETMIASNAMDQAMERHAPRVNNPVPVTDDNLIAGIKVYNGDLDYKPSALEHSLYPPPPQLVLDPMDDPEWHIYYAVRTGVRYTGMPAWGKALSEQDIWKVTAFLARVDKLPPAVQEYCKKTYGVEPQSHQSEEHEHSGHHHD
jgi:Cytochrome C oxidase, cbb3-type, subunit III